MLTPQKSGGRTTSIAANMLLEVTVPASPPATESYAHVRLSGILQNALPRDQHRFSDGNTAWWSECQRLGLKTEKVAPQNKEWTKDKYLPQLHMWPLLCQIWQGHRSLIVPDLHSKRLSQHPSQENLVTQMPPSIPRSTKWLSNGCGVATWEL